ncbi:FliG C-terminal domain-containing protein [Halorhodospira halochloris]|uniref:FliG C-terminal domain-containing protein n=1 Tax=Halorhodospira halochloris TaxID=1052 RepID=UPI001EE8D8A1|nr:FliG C-terminal domain-containing protein [Halorhodospira halochloris]MCG5547980.1 hypothetical protein [Halorhodospira halochloris]
MSNQEMADLSLHVQAVRATVEPEAEDGTRFNISFSGDNGVVATVSLSREALFTLGVECVQHVPNIAPELQSADSAVAEAYRGQVRGLARLSNSNWQRLLRELDTGTLICFLWFMKDAEILQRALSNLSQRAAEMLMEDMEARWHGQDPDQVPEVEARQGREAVDRVLAAWRKLHESGALEHN